LAEWLLDLIEREVFADPSEAVSSCCNAARLGAARRSAERASQRKLDAAINDPRPGHPLNEAFDRLQKELAGPRPEPALCGRAEGSVT